MKRRTFICATALICAAAAFAQGGSGNAQKADKPRQQRWTSMAPRLQDGFFLTDEALRIGDNVLLYQHSTGGWPKNVNMQTPLDDAQKAKVAGDKGNADESTIDNKATTTEITYLARLYNATGREEYLDGAMRGLDYLFRAQYDNGGWPQFYPRAGGYYAHITFNDDAMVNVLTLMRDIATGLPPFGFLPDSVRDKARKALDKGVDCILKTQIVQDGRLTAWCAQYDEHTLEPAGARTYELVSISGQESDGIVLFLMSLPEPSPEVVNSIEGAVEWLRRSEIHGLRFEFFSDGDGERDYRMVACGDGEECPPLWARFYTIDTNRPFFCDRDGVMRYDISEIGRERRTGYSWYNYGGLDVYKRYEAWSKEQGR